MTDDRPQVPTGSFRAVVRAGAEATAYRRAGSGRPFVVLAGPVGSQPALARMIDALAARFRVIVPEVETPPNDFGGWLRRFLDGIGVEAVVLVADPARAAPALGCAMLDGDRVAGVVLLDEEAGPVRGGPGRLPILVIPPGLEPAEAIRRIDRFLGQGGMEPEPRAQ